MRKKAKENKDLDPMEFILEARARRARMSKVFAPVIPDGHKKKTKLRWVPKIKVT